MRKLIYLISPEKIYSDFYKDLNKVLETRKIKFFQLRLKKISKNKTIKIAKLLHEYDVKVNILDTRIANDVGDMTFSQFNECLNNAKEYKENDLLLTKIAML